jgi:DNA-binding FadR family transcriptional regulator
MRLQNEDSFEMANGPAAHIASQSSEDPRILEAVGFIREYISAQGIVANGRLPPENDLARALNVTRGRLRQAFQILEKSGEIWRHVGKGTFVGAGKPLIGASPRSSETLHSEDQSILERTNPLEVLEARLLIEPKLAAFAAVRGTPSDFRALRQLAAEERDAVDVESAQKAGSQLHRAISTAASNELLSWLFDKIFAIREATSWGKIRPETLGAEERSANNSEHVEIVKAIALRDPRQAEVRMRSHLETLKKTILASTDG